MIAVARIDGQKNNIAFRDLYSLRLNIDGAAHVESAFGEDAGSIVAAVFEPPRDAIAASRVSVDDLHGDADFAFDGAFPRDGHILRRRGMHRDLVRRHSA